MGKFLPARLKKAREDAGLIKEGFARSLVFASAFVSLPESGEHTCCLFRAPALNLSPKTRDDLERFNRHVVPPWIGKYYP